MKVPQRAACLWIPIFFWLAGPVDAWGEVVVTASAPSAAVAPGASATVNVFFLNDGPSPAGVDAPELISARFLSPEKSTPVSLHRRTPLPPGGLIVAAGAFGKAAYELNVPPGMSGTLVLELDRPGSPRTALLVAAPAGAATAPVAGAPAQAPGETPVLPTTERGDSGIAQYIADRFTGHEPMYFVAGPDSPRAKFQLSFKYQLLDPEGSLTQSLPLLGGFHVAYSQTSFWDLDGDSNPFFDTSYRPELLWSADDVKLDMGPMVSRLGVQVGIEHESNGKDGDDSRSLNYVYLRPTFTFGQRQQGLFLTVAPKVFTYIADLSDNPDIKDYRGYAELRTIVGWENGLQLSTVGRLGDDWDKGSLQFDLTYPLKKITGGNIDLFLDAQYFNGFGESLLNYDESTSAFRIGLSLVR